MDLIKKTLMWLDYSLDFLFKKLYICLQWMSDQMQMAVSKEVTPWPPSAVV